jgi:uncharacterized membrane protein YkgB
MRNHFSRYRSSQSGASLRISARDWLDRHDEFTGDGAQGIEPLVAQSPLLSWMYGLWTVRQFAAGLGVVEICIAILIASRPWSRKASAIGSAAAVLMFLTTLSFLFPTPGWSQRLGGFPALSGSWTVPN